MTVDGPPELPNGPRVFSVPPKAVAVSLDVVWAGSTGKHDARMSEISMAGCFIDSKSQGRGLGETVEFKVHLPDGPWVSLQGELIVEDYPIGFELRFVKLSEADNRLLAQVVLANGGNPGAYSSNLANQELSVQFKEPSASVNRPDVFKSGSAVAPQSHAGIKGRVLLADDDSLTLRIVSAIAKTEGYEPVPAADGREALRILQQDGLFCAAIFDMTMPYLQGLDLILYMKAEERLRHIPIGMITAEQDPKVWDESVAAGASVFLPKPFTPQQVAMMLRMLASKSLE